MHVAAQRAGARAWQIILCVVRSAGRRANQPQAQSEASLQNFAGSAILVKAVDGAHRAAVMALAVTATGLASSSGDIDGQGLPNTLSVWT